MSDARDQRRTREPALTVPRGEDTAPAGMVIVDKPQGVTSHDVVSAVRRLAATRQVGHGGTLDPMATGVLVLGIGNATRMLTYVTGHDKTYEATICFGITTDSDDADGEIRATVDASHITAEAIDGVLADLTGEIMQVPSSVSAIKINGKRAHALHREGRDVKLAARPVTVTRFERVSDIRVNFADPCGHASVSCDVVVECSSGTYVRALARDAGHALAVGAHLTRLRRTRVGGWGIEESRSIDDLADQIRSDGHLATISLDEASRRMFPAITLAHREATTLCYGNIVTVDATAVPAGAVGENCPMLAVYDGSRFVTLVTTVPHGDGRVVLHPKKVFSTPDGH